MSSIDISSLCKHAFIEEIKGKICSEQSKCLDVMAYGHDILYVWNSFEAWVHTVNIKHCIRDDDLKTQVILQPMQGIVFTAERIFLNVSSTQLALTACSDGNSGIAILNLPNRWSTSQQKIRIPCKNIGEKLFLGEQLTLRQAKFHPGSPKDSHMLVLTSDECLRLFDTLTGEVLWKCILSHKINRAVHPSIPSKVSLGDTPVDFDVSSTPLEDNLSSPLWSIFVLWGNGDIYSVNSGLSDTGDKIQAVGPLRMFPSSDDNYGSDASSIIVLQSAPPIIAFSTSVGTIYNCLLLNSEDQQNGFEKSLYVVECIELELGISLSQDDEIVSCPIRLMKSPVEKSMYFLVHKAGIHSVTLPLVSKLYDFLESHDSEFPPYSSESLVEYLLCTGVNKGSSLDSLPLLGCSFIDLSSSLLVLLNNQNMINIRITPHILHSMEILEADCTRNVDSDGFLMHIQKILKDHGPGPVVKLPESDPQDLFNIIYKIKLSYKDTMEAHETVAKKLETKSNSLFAALIAQENEIQRLKAQQEILLSQAQMVANRYTEVNEKQMSLTYRLENILKNVNNESKLTEKERTAMDFLQNIQMKIGIFNDDIKKIQSACRHHEKAVQNRAENMTRISIALSDSRGRTMQKQLHSLTSEISQLMNRIKSIEESVPELMYQTLPSVRKI